MLFKEETENLCTSVNFLIFISNELFREADYQLIEWGDPFSRERVILLSRVNWTSSQEYLVPFFESTRNHLSGSCEF